MTQLLETAAPSTFLGAPYGGNALVAIAHPDDEFLIGGALDLFRSKDINVHAVIATDGEASDRGDPELLRNYHRRYEAGKALAKYGIRMENQHFLGLPDGELSADDHIDVLAQRIGQLLGEHTVRSVITLGYHGFDNHEDHRAVHFAAEISANAYVSANPNIQLFGLTRNPADVEIPADPAAKLRRLSYHKSQFDIDLTDPTYQPVLGTVEQPGIRLSPDSRRQLEKYFQNMDLERYQNYPLGTE